MMLTDQSSLGSLDAARLRHYLPSPGTIGLRVEAVREYDGLRGRLESPVAAGSQCIQDLFTRHHPCNSES